MPIYELTSRDVQEIEDAVKWVVKKRLNPARLTRRDFPLISLASTIATIDRSAGYCLIRGIPIERFTLTGLCILLCGLGAQFGSLVAQDVNGAVIHHVRAVTNSPVRGYQTSSGLPFHTDSCDTIGLLMVRNGNAGGLSILANVQAVHDAIANIRPDVLQILYEPFHIERHSGVKGYYSTPVFMKHKGRLFCRFNPGYIYAAQREAETPRLTANQEEAIQLFLDQCNLQSNQIIMALRPGDLQLLDNNLVVHSRTAYTDSPEFAEQRHLLRLWLFNSQMDDLPEPMHHRYRDIESWKPRLHLPSCE